MKARLRRQSTWLWLTGVAVATPVLVVLRSLLQWPAGSSNQGDIAATELAVQNALRFRQLLGPYDRFGWNHPGPAFFYALAGPYALVSHRAVGIKIGALAINAVCTASIVGLVARRRGPRVAAGAAAVILGFFTIIGSSYLTNAWSPVAITLPSALLVVLCADLAAGHAWSLVPAVVVGSFVVQTDVGLLAVVGTAVVGAAVVCWTSSRAALLWAAASAGCAGLAMWALPVFQQTARPYGNLGLVARFFRDHRGSHGLGDAVRLVANGMLIGTPPNRTLQLPGPVGDYTLPLVGLVVAASVVVALAVRRGDRFGAVLAVSPLLLGTVYAVSLRSAEGELQGYFVVWARSLTLCAALGGVVVLGGVVMKWRVAAAGMASVLLLASAAVTRQGLNAIVHRTWAGIGDSTLALAGQIPRRDGRVLMCIALDAGPDAEGLVANLRRDGLDVRVEERWLLVFGTDLAPTGRETTAVVVSRPRDVLVFRIYRGARVDETLCPPVPDTNPSARYRDYLRSARDRSSARARSAAARRVGVVQPMASTNSTISDHGCVGTENRSASSNPC